MGVVSEERYRKKNFERKTEKDLYKALVVGTIPEKGWYILKRVKEMTSKETIGHSAPSLLQLMFF